MHFLTRGSTFRSQPGSRDGLDLSLLINKVLQDTFIIESNTTCCFGPRNLFIKKGLTGKGTLNLEKAIVDILVGLGFDVSLECCNSKYSIPKTILTNKYVGGVFDLKKEVKNLLNYYDIPYSDPCCPLEDDPSIIELNLVNEEGDIDLQFPLVVLNVNNEYLGIADDEEEYITLWNADPANAALGTILNGVDTAFNVHILDLEGPEFNLYGLEFFTVTSNNANAVMHVEDNDLVIYGATVVRGSTGVLTASSTINEYNGTFGVIPETSFSVRRVTTVSSALSQIHVAHSRVSTYVAMNALTDCNTLSGVLPKACITFCLRVTLTTDLVSNVVNWSELDQIQTFSVMGLGGGVYNITNAAFVPQPPPSTIGIALRDIGPSPLLDLTDFTWFTDANLPNLRRILISSNLGDLIGDSVNWFLTMPKVDKQLTITNNNDALNKASAVNADLAINRIATALSGIVPVSPKTIRLEDTTNRTAASTASSTALTTATWAVTYT